MNVFMGYNPLVTKQAKVTVWVCEQDGATPVAPSNPNEGDCFVVYATDEAVLSNTPTSKKTYANGEWADAESGGGGEAIPEVTLNMTSTTEGTYTSTVPFDQMYTMGDIYSDGRFALVLHPNPTTDLVVLATAFQESDTRSLGITLNSVDIVLMEDGTVQAGGH